MHLFSELDGSKGEVFATRILKYLLQHSAIFRYEFINFLNNEIEGANLNIEKWFKCKKEVPSKVKDSDEEGYIDLVIKIDNAIIGIENKFGAEFTNNQPEKYWGKIKKLAKEHEGGVKSYLLVLCPRNRKKKIEDKLKKSEDTIQVIVWEDLLKYFSNKKPTHRPIFSVFGKNDESIFGSDIVSEYLFINFKLFLEGYLKFPSNFGDIYKDIGSDNEVGHKYRNDFLRKLQTQLDLDDFSISRSKKEHFYGFYLINRKNETNDKIDKAWFGFIGKKRIKDKYDNDFDLIVASNFKVDFIDNLDPFSVESFNPRIKLFGEKAEFVWKVNYKADWTTIEKWKNVIEQFIEPLDLD